MGFNKIDVKPIYHSVNENIIEEFYIPVLSESITYKRVSAYFDANIVNYYARGLEQIVNKNGHVYFIFSNQLNEHDFNLMKQGYLDREYLDNTINKMFVIDEVTNELMNLAYLIKHGFVDIKIAFTKRCGIFHDKFGLMEDNQANTVYFRGSNNETMAAIESNYESFETSCSWNADGNELFKINAAKQTFDNLWTNNFSDEVITVDFPDVLKEKLISFSPDKLIVTNLPKENCFIMDYNNQLIGLNKLTNQFTLSTESNFYKTKMNSFITRITNNEYYFDPSMGYKLILRFVRDITDYSRRTGFEIYITPNLNKYFIDCDIQIDKRRSLGIAIKNKFPILQNDVNHFKNILENQMERELREPQIWGAYHLAKMKRAANFSVPGSGKTSIVYGSFAYLSSKQINEANKVVMIGPINSFSSWEIEFRACFGSKKELKVFNSQKIRVSHLGNLHDKVVYESSDCNLFLFNYESLGTYLNVLEKIIDSKTILVFDEVHRIKNIVGKRAALAKQVCLKANYRFVLTGTPIPNGYVDIFNMLNILFSDDYEDYFNFDEQYLLNAKDDDMKKIAINNKIYPFFCRTNKQDLFVPPAEPDDITSGYCVATEKESKLFDIIYRTFSHNILNLYIRLIQASCNPRLLLNKIDQSSLNVLGVEGYFDQSKIADEDYNFIESFDMTSKFWRGIEIIKEKIKEGPIIVWAIFIDTIERIKTELVKENISAEVIIGNVAYEKREEIIKNFKSGNISVLITNPHTMGESVSLHQICHQAIYFELSFNLVHLLQSKDRIHRLGLGNDVKTKYYFLLLDNQKEMYSTIDLKIYNRLVEKERLQERALSSNEIYVLEDDIKKDIREVLGFNIK